MSRREELAWCAGLFDGEGWVAASPRPRTIRQLRLAITQLDRRVLDRFQVALGVGKVYGPYAQGHKNPLYCYKVAGFEHGQYIVASLWPWLSPVKRQQAADALRTVKESRALGVHARPHCGKGHPYTETNLRVVVTADRGTRRICRTCMRDNMRASRARRKAATA